MKILTYNLFGIQTEPNYFAHRLEPISEIVLAEDADLLCLQEAHRDQVDEIVKRSFGTYEICYTLTQALDDQGRLYSTEEEEFLKLHGIVVILIKRNFAYQVVQKRLVFEGDFIDCGTIFVELRHDNKKPLCVYNCHFTGGSYGLGLKDIEIQRRRDYRTSQYAMLLQDVKSSITKYNGDVEIIIAGDFNSDSDKLDVYPEASQAVELVLGGDDGYCISDAWKTLVGTTGTAGETESTSRNKFRAHLKPMQRREARFDRILLGSSNNSAATMVVTSIKLVGNEQVKTVKSPAGDDVPIFPSDHFGLCATIKLV